MLGTPSNRFSLVILLRRRLRLKPGGRRSPDGQTEPENPAAPDPGQFQGKRHIPFTATAQGKIHGRDTIWEMRARAEGLRNAVGSFGSHQSELAWCQLGIIVAGRQLGRQRAAYVVDTGQAADDWPGTNRRTEI